MTVASEGEIAVRFTRRKPDSCVSGNVVAEFAAPSHVHFEDDHAQEVAVFSGFALARSWDGLGIVREITVYSREVEASFSLAVGGA